MGCVRFLKAAKVHGGWERWGLPCGGEEGACDVACPAAHVGMQCTCAVHTQTRTGAHTPHTQACADTVSDVLDCGAGFILQKLYTGMGLLAHGGQGWVCFSALEGLDTETFLPNNAYSSFSLLAKVVFLNHLILWPVAGRILRRPLRLPPLAGGPYHPLPLSGGRQPVPGVGQWLL